MALNLRQLFHGGLGRAEQARHVDPGALQQRLGAIVLAQHGGQHVGRFDESMVLAQGQRLGFAQGFLEFGG